MINQRQSTYPDREPVQTNRATSVDEPMNRAIFTQYVRQYLVPELNPGDVVILDNLSSHKGAEAAALVEACGATLLFLPPYSPISTRSRWSSPSSKTCCEKQASAPATDCGTASAPFSTTSRRTNAQTTSGTPGMLRCDRKPL